MKREMPRTANQAHVLRCMQCFGKVVSCQADNGRVIEGEIVQVLPYGHEFVEHESKCTIVVRDHESKRISFWAPEHVTFIANNAVIVSRHPAAVEFLKGFSLFEEAPVIAEAKREDIEDRIVGGNLPFHLARFAEVIWAIEFPSDPPRGREYSAEDMRKAGARIRAYTVYHVGDD